MTTDDELARAEQLARDIHAVVKGRTDTHDHGLVMNLRCVLDHLAQAAPAAPGDADEALIARLRKTAEGGRSPILGHLHVEDRLMLEAADAISRLRLERDTRAGWLAQMVIDKLGGTDDLPGWVYRSAGYYREAYERIETLEGALGAFVASYEETEVIGDHDDQVIWIRVSVGMCRRARQLIKGKRGE